MLKGYSQVKTVVISEEARKITELNNCIKFLNQKSEELNAKARKVLQEYQLAMRNISDNQKKLLQQKSMLEEASLEITKRVINKAVLGY